MLKIGSEMVNFINRKRKKGSLAKAVLSKGRLGSKIVVSHEKGDYAVLTITQNSDWTTISVKEDGVLSKTLKIRETPYTNSDTLDLMSFINDNTVHKSI